MDNPTKKAWEEFKKEDSFSNSKIDIIEMYWDFYAKQAVKTALKEERKNREIKIIDIAKKLSTRLEDMQKQKIQQAIRNTIKKENKAINSESRGSDFFWHKELKKELKRLE